MKEKEKRKAPSPLTRAIPSQDPKPPTPTSNTTTICSSFLRTVCLHDWWLIQVEIDSKGQGLGVAGFVSRERQGIRLFGSAAIVKRHDTVTLETVDGITITISGLINRSLTHQNGFPSDFCSHFLLGFPYYWEEYAARYLCEESTSRAVPSRISSLDGINMPLDGGTKSSLPISFDDLPVTRVRDMMSTMGNSEDCDLTRSIFNDILHKYGGKAFKPSGPSVQSNEKGNGGVMTRESALDETPRDHERNEGEQNYKDDNKMSDATLMRPDKFQEVHHQYKKEESSSEVMTKVGVDVSGLSRGVATRSMTRLKNLKNKQEEIHPLDPCIKHGLSEPSSASETSGNQFGNTIIKTNAPNVSHAAILTQEKIEVKEARDKSAARRSSRLKNLNDPFSTSEASGNQSGAIETRRNARKKKLRNP